MNIEGGSFRIRTDGARSDRAWNGPRRIPSSLESRAAELVFRSPHLREAARVAELGLGAAPAARAEVASLLSPVAVYVGLDPTPEHRTRAESALGVRGAFPAFGPDDPLPLEAGSLDLLLSLFTLERLRMDQLYFALAEAKRVVKPGGHAVFATLHPGRTWWERFASYWQRRRGRGDPLRLEHYLSPEDWTAEREEYVSERGRCVQVLWLVRNEA